MKINVDYYEKDAMILIGNNEQEMINYRKKEGDPHGEQRTFWSFDTENAGFPGGSAG